MREKDVDFIGFIQSLDEKQLRYIAASDYGDQQNEYFKALQQVIIYQSCIIYPEQIWVEEVISLCSSSLTPKHAKEYIACTLLLIINRGIFENLDLQQKFRNQEYDYHQLSEPYHHLINTAYKWAGL